MMRLRSYRHKIFHENVIKAEIGRIDGVAYLHNNVYTIDILKGGDTDADT